MNKTYSISRIVLIISLLLVLTCSSAFAEERNIAILDFQNASQVSNRYLGTAAADIAAEELVNWGKCNVIEREQIKALLNEQAFGLTGSVDAATAARVGEVTGAQYMLVGKITEAGIREKSYFGVATETEMFVGVSIRIIDTSTSRLVFAGSANAKKKGFSASKHNGQELVSSELSAGDFTEVTRKAIQNVMQKLDTSKFAKELDI